MHSHIDCCCGTKGGDELAGWDIHTLVFSGDFPND